jgi:hypothetical protein
MRMTRERETVTREKTGRKREITSSIILNPIDSLIGLLEEERECF